MNLATDKHIKVMMIDGSEQELSLEEVFATAAGIRTLQGGMSERVAIISELAAIGQLSCGRIRNTKDWLACRERIVPAAVKYLRANRDKFELFGEKAFYQVPEIGRLDEVVDSATLCLDRASNNSTSHFDHQSVSRPPSQADLARALGQYQLFDPMGYLMKPDVWTGEVCTSKSAAPLSSKLLMVVEGENLLDTIWFHIVSEDRVGKLKIDKPAWERRLTSRQDFESYLIESYYAHLLPFTRAVFLREDGSMNLSETLRGKPSPWHAVRHPMEIEDANGLPMSLNQNQEVWRQLAAVLVVNTDCDRMPWAFSKALSLRPRGRVFLFVGGVGCIKAEVASPMESVFCIEPWDDALTWIRTYANRFAEAEFQACNLNTAMRKYAVEMCGGKGKHAAKAGDLVTKAMRAYWFKISCNRKGLWNASGGQDIAAMSAHQEKWRSICEREARNIHNCFAQTFSEVSCRAYGESFWTWKNTAANSAKKGVENEG